MSDKLTDHDIVSLYKTGAKEQPSKALDTHILQLAQEQSNTAQVTPIIKKRRFYQTWYGQFSTAASFLLVAVLYFENKDAFLDSPSPVNDQSEIIQSNEFHFTPTLIPSQEHKKAKRQSQKEQSKSSESIEVETLEILATQISDSTPQAASVAAKMTKVIEKTDFAKIESSFKQIEKFLNKGEKDKASALLKQLLTTYPALKEEFNKRYKALE